MNEKDEVKKGKKSIIGAKIRVTYSSDDDVPYTAEGICYGSQNILSEEDWFLILKTEDDVDRLIAVSKIIHIDVMEVKYLKPSEEKVMPQYA